MKENKTEALTRFLLVIIDAILVILINQYTFKAFGAGAAVVIMVCSLIVLSLISAAILITIFGDDADR